MAASNGTKRVKARVTGERARAWLVTAINPLLRALPIEDSHLTQRRCAWRFASRRCEVLRPCREMAPSLFVDNLDDFLAKNYRVARLVERHDRKLEALEAKLAQAHRALTSDAAFRDLVSARIHEFGAAFLKEGPDGAHDPERAPALVAELILNNVVDANGTSLARFWERYGRELLEARSSPPARDFARAADAAADELLEVVRKLEEALKRGRAKLCDEHGLPPTPLVGEPYFAAAAEEPL